MLGLELVNLTPLTTYLWTVGGSRSTQRKPMQTSQRKARPDDRVDHHATAAPPQSQTMHTQKQKLRALSQTLQVLDRMLNVKLHNSIIRYGLNKYCMFGRVNRKKRLHSEKWLHGLSLQSCI